MGTYMNVVKNLFYKFDLDGGGELDGREMRGLMQALYPKAHRNVISKAMLSIQKFLGHDETLELSSFIDAYSEAVRVVKEQMGDSTAGLSPRRMSSSSNLPVVPLERSASQGDRATRSPIAPARKEQEPVSTKPPTPPELEHIAAPEVVAVEAAVETSGNVS